MLIFKEQVLIVNANPIELLAYDNILYCVSEYGYVEIYHTDSNIFLVKTTIKHLSESLPESFVKINRSTIINLDHCSSFKSGNCKGKIKMSDKKEFDVSRRLTKNTKTKLLDYICSFNEMAVI